MNHVTIGTTARIASAGKPITAPIVEADQVSQEGLPRWRDTGKSIVLEVQLFGKWMEVPIVIKP